MFRVSFCEQFFVISRGSQANEWVEETFLFLFSFQKLAQTRRINTQVANYSLFLFFSIKNYTSNCRLADVA